MKKIIFILCIFYFASCTHHTVPSSTPVLNKEIINAKNQTILIGRCSASALRGKNNKEWFNKSYSDYKVDTTTVLQIEPRLQQITMEIFLGTWCGDSRREVPHMLKILETAHVDTNNIRLIFVDNTGDAYKQSPQHEEAGKNIHHVPTFIIYKGNKEVNRIIESPVVSLEKDLAAILTGNDYVPNYKAITYWTKNVKSKQKPMSDDELKTQAASIKPLCKSPGDFNAYGYVLLAQKRYAEAINVFRLNTIIYSDYFGTYDSLGEGYYKMGNKEEAKKWYQKVLQMKPEDANAKKMLEELDK